MNVLCIFSGQGYQQDNLYAFFQDDKNALSYLNQLQDLMKIKGELKQLIGNPDYSQLTISAYQLTLFHSIHSVLLAHTLTFAGYSLGEVCAFLASTEASPILITEVISYRTQLMTSLLKEANAPDYDLVSIYGTFKLNEIKETCLNYDCHIAIINSEQRIVIGGPTDNLKKLVKDVTFVSMKKVQFLSIHLPSHTPFYANKQGQFRQWLLNKCTDQLKYPLMSPLTLSKIYNSYEEIELLDEELYSTLHWNKVCDLIHEYSYDLIIDLGPGNAMSHFLNENASIHGLISASDYKNSIGFKIALSKILMI